MHELIWSQRAVRELETIARYIARENEQAADKLKREILQRTLLVASQPGIGSFLLDFDDPALRQIVVGRYRVIYRISTEQKTVSVITIWHGSRRDPDLADS